MYIFEWKCEELFQELLNRGIIIHGKSSLVNINHTYALTENLIKHNTSIEGAPNRAFKNFKLSTLHRIFVVEYFQGEMDFNKPKWLLHLLIISIII